MKPEEREDGLDPDAIVFPVMLKNKRTGEVKTSAEWKDGGADPADLFPVPFVKE